MKRIILFCFTVVLLSGCGSSVNPDECTMFCKKMSDLSATGGWECLTVDVPDYNPPVSEGDTVISIADYNQYLTNLTTRGNVISSYNDILKMMNDSRYLCDARQIVLDDTTSQPICQAYTATSDDNPDDGNEYTYWRTILNPTNYNDCLTSCLVDTSGDSIPENMRNGILMAGSKEEFLSAQFDRQCYIEAVEK